jgi:hypothetical protein
VANKSGLSGVCHAATGGVKEQPNPASGGLKSPEFFALLAVGRLCLENAVRPF